MVRKDLPDLAGNLAGIDVAEGLLGSADLRTELHLRLLCHQPDAVRHLQHRQLADKDSAGSARCVGGRTVLLASGRSGLVLADTGQVDTALCQLLLLRLDNLPVHRGESAERGVEDIATS